MTTKESYRKSDAVKAITELRELERRHDQRSSDRRARENAKRKRLAYDLNRLAGSRLIPKGERVMP